MSEKLPKSEHDHDYDYDYREWLLSVIRGTEERLTLIITAHKSEVLARDIDHEKRIGGLEKIGYYSGQSAGAHAGQVTGKTAGAKSGLAMGTLASAIITIIVAIAQAIR
jgi:hypothetical protein